MNHKQHSYTNVVLTGLFFPLSFTSDSEIPIVKSICKPESRLGPTSARHQTEAKACLETTLRIYQVLE